MTDDARHLVHIFRMEDFCVPLSMQNWVQFSATLARHIKVKGTQTSMSMKAGRDLPKLGKIYRGLLFMLDFMVNG